MPSPKPFEVLIIAGDTNNRDFVQTELKLFSALTPAASFESIFEALNRNPTIKVVVIAGGSSDNAFRFMTTISREHQDLPVFVVTDWPTNFFELTAIGAKMPVLFFDRSREPRMANFLPAGLLLEKVKAEVIV